MSISVTPTRLALASIDQQLVIAAHHFDSHSPQSTITENFLSRLFLAPCRSETAVIDLYVFRVLIDTLLATDYCSAANFLLLSSRSSPANSGIIVQQQEQSLLLTGSVSRSKSAFIPSSLVISDSFSIKAGFCAYVIRKLVETCICEPSACSVRRFYRFVVVLEEKLLQIRYNSHTPFIATFLITDLSLCSIAQALIILILVTTSVIPQVVSSSCDFLQTIIANSLEKGKEKGINSAKVVNCEISTEFVHQLFAFSFSLHSIEPTSIDRKAIVYFLRNLEEEFISQSDTLTDTIAPLRFLLASTSSNSGIFTPSSPSADHLSPGDYLDIEEKDLENIMDNLAYQGSNLLPQQIQEIGASFTSNVKTCRQHLVTLNAADASSLSSVNISRVVVMMINTYSGTNVAWDNRAGSVPGAENAAATTTILSEGLTAQPAQLVAWNAKVFVSVVKELVPAMNWSEVVMHLDQTNFFVRNRSQLQFLTSLLLEGLGTTPFPIALLYRDWNFHKPGQLSWIEQIVHNPDIFYLADYPHRIVNLSPLKVQPDECRDLGNWRCLDLLDTILRLGESRKLVNNLMTLLHKPMSGYPDVILLALLQIQPPVTSLRSHLCQILIPILIGNHPNAVSVLNVAWNCEELNNPPSFHLRTIILTSMCNYYMKSPEDQSKLTRILEVAHELKPNGLAELFNLSQFQFTIDLACLASRRDFLKLDKWIDDKLTENGDNFALHIISYIRRRMSINVINNAQQGSTIPQDTLKVLLSALSRFNTTVANTNNEIQQLFHQLQLQSKNNDNRVPNIPTSRPQMPLGGSGSHSSSNLFGGFGAPGAPVQQPGSNFGNFPFGTSGYGAANREQVLAAAQQIQNRQQQGGMPASMQMFGGITAGSGPFGQNSDIFKPSFGSSHALSMSPSGQMRTNFLNVSNAQSGQTRSGGVPAGPGWGVQNAPPPGPGGLRTTPGPNVQPTSNIDFRAQIPPTAPGNLMNSSNNFTPSSVQQSQQQGVDGANGRLMMPSTDELTSVTFTEEIQSEANMYFQQIYSQHTQMPVPEFVSRLKVFSNSPLQKDKEVLACIIKNLFEEYRFFHDYPERELRTTAEVYGSLIREGVISNFQFVPAVRRMIESLQAEPGTMLWTFGIVALNACRTKLKEYPKICVMVANLHSFQNFPPALKDYVTAGIQCQLPQTQGRETPNWQQQMQQIQHQRSNSGATSSTADVKSIVGRSGTSVLSVTSVDTLVNATEREGTQIKQPSENVTEKVSFLFNNLSQMNLPRKVEEIKAMAEELGDDFLQWLAQYLVMKRVSIEQNFQPLYNLFLSAIDDPRFETHVKRETFRNIKILLRSDKRQAATNFGDRQLLKNLGLWLGAITIARDAPIVIEELDIKSLLMEAYYKGQQELLFVVPFIAKILVSSNKSQIFGSNCSWLRAIFKILAEVHNQPDLKLNLKFEIEVLCKELGVDVTKLGTDDILKDTERLICVPQQLSDLKLLKQPEMQLPLSPVPAARTNAEGNTETTSGNFSKSVDTEFVARQSPSVTQMQTPAHFHYHDINIVSFDGLAPHLKLSSSLPLFQLNPQLKHVIRPALNHAIKELIGPVTERAIRIAMHVTEHICKKDFSLDPDEQRLRRASHHMIRAMTAGMASITCRDPLGTTIQCYLKQAFTNSLRGNPITPEQQKYIDEAVATITEDNVELATNFIVKTACEKATPEMDKRLESEFVARRQCRSEGLPFGDPVAVARAQQLPEKIRLHAGPVTQQQMAVYYEFSSRICGFKPTTAEDMIVDYNIAKSSPTMQPIVQQPGTMEKEVEKFVQTLQELVHNIDAALNSYGVPHYRASSAIAAIRDGISQLASNPREAIQLHNCIQRLVEQMLYAYKSPDNLQNTTTPEMEWNKRLKDVFIQVCRILLTQLSINDLARRITRVIVECRLDYRFNLDAMDLLVKHMLVQMSIYDQHLSTEIDTGNNFEAMMFAQRFLKLLSMGSGMNTRPADVMPLTMDQLTKMQHFGQNRPTPDSFGVSTISMVGDAASIGSRSTPGLMPVVSIGDRLHNSGLPPQLSSIPPPGSIGSSMSLRLGGASEGSEGDAAELQSKVEMILREWIQLCYTPVAQKDPQQALANIVHVMHEQGVLSTDEMITRFFRLCTEMCVDVSYRLLKNDITAHQTTVVRQRCYYTLDAFVRLTCLMIKHSDGSQYQTKVNLLKKVLSIVTNVLHLDHEVRGTEFHAMPYQRILIIMFNELTAPDPNLDPIAWNILEAFGQALFILQPRRVTGFAYAWLDIIGHRNFIGRLLKDSAEPLKTAAMYTQLLICHLKFLAPFLRNVTLPKAIAVMYKGTLRVLLVILHDFPELLCEYHIVICDTIPPNCVQLRNLILSAYPKNMRLPDPFGPNLKVDSLVEMTQEPKMHTNITTIIPNEIRTQLDDYLNTRSSVDFHVKLPSLLQVSIVVGSKYNTSVINAVVIYVGMRAIQAIQEKQQCITMTTIAHTAYMDVFQNLAVSLCTEGRYLLFNAIANQLRYPNSHTHYFSCTLLYLFLEADTEIIQEQITRILFERLVALRPHPWGLLITFIELIKNPSYGFWKHEFVRCAPEIERLFQSVANSCAGASARHSSSNVSQNAVVSGARNSPQAVPSVQ